MLPAYYVCLLVLYKLKQGITEAISRFLIENER